MAAGGLEQTMHGIDTTVRLREILSKFGVLKVSSKMINDGQEK